MATISVDDDHLVVSITGIDRILALKSELRIPLSHIRSVSARPEVARSWFHGLRIVGTSLPGVVRAGTFYTGDGKAFFDIHDPDRTIELDLDHESYKQAIVQVDDPDAAVARIQAALK